MSVLTELELIGFPDITSKELKRVKNFIDDCNVVSINEEIKQIYQSLRKRYRLKLGDATAAATAVYLEIPFISADKIFGRVSELKLTSYVS